MTIGQEAERRREARLAETVVTNAAKGRGGVTSLEEVLRVTGLDAEGG